MKKAKTKPNPSPLPVFDSMAQCSGATGIPLSVIRNAKRSGCPGFAWHRVELAALLRWMFREDGTADQDWSAQLVRWNAELAKLRLDRERALMVDRAEVITGLRSAMVVLFGEIDRRFLNELPPVLRGLGEVEIRAKASAAVEDLRTSLRARFDALGKGES